MLLNLNLANLLKGLSILRPSTQLEEKLADINYPLEEYLQNEEAIQCYKDMKPNAKKYFTKDKIKQLIKYSTEEPENDDYLKAHKYPYIASELLKTDCNLVQDLFVLNEEEYNQKYKEVEKEINTNTNKIIKPEGLKMLENISLEFAIPNKLENKDNNNKEEDKNLEDKKEDIVNDKDEDQKDEIKEKIEEIKIDEQKNNKENIEKINDNEKESIIKVNNNKEEIQNQKEVEKIKNINDEKCNEIKEKEINKDEKDLEKNENKIIEENKENKDNNINNIEIKEIENKQDNNIKKEEDKQEAKDNIGNDVLITRNEFLDLLLNFIITEKTYLNDVLCGYFANILISLIDKYPTKLLIYLYTIRKDALKQIVLHSYQKSLSILTLKILKIEILLNSVTTEIKTKQMNFNYDSLLNKVEEIYSFRNELLKDIILSINLDGFKNQRGEIIKNINLESIFTILYDLVSEKSVIRFLLFNDPLYSHIFGILKTIVFNKENNDQNKQYIYKLFLVLVTKIFSNMNKIKEFDFMKDLDSEICFSDEIENIPKYFFANFIEAFLIIIFYNFIDNSSINGSNNPKEKGWGLGLHNIYIMDLVYELCLYMNPASLGFDEMMIKSNFIIKAIDYFFKYQLNNIYHCKFIKLYKLFIDCESCHPKLIDLLFNKIKFHEILVEYANEKEIIIPKINNKEIEKNIKDENNSYINKYYYKSGKTTLSCMFAFIIDLIYKIQQKSGLKIFDEKEKNDLNIKNIGEFEFIKDENSSNDIILFQFSKKLNEILKASTIWCNIFNSKILPLIKKYESKLCPQKDITNTSSAKIAMTNNNNNLMKSLLNIIAKNPKIVPAQETNEKYNDVNFWETKPSISLELKTKITNNQENISNISNNNNDNKEINNNINEEEKDNENNIIDEEDELLGLAMKLEQKEKSEKFKSNLKNQKMNIILTNDNLNNKNTRNIKNSATTPDLKSTQNINSKPIQNKDIEEKNSKYNDTNFWEVKPEYLLNKNEMENIILDL